LLVFCVVKSRTPLLTCSHSRRMSICSILSRNLYDVYLSVTNYISLYELCVFYSWFILIVNKLEIYVCVCERERERVEVRTSEYLLV
jgi:hypothetical protein